MIGRNFEIGRRRNALIDAAGQIEAGLGSEMDSLTEGLLIWLSLMVLAVFTVGMTAKLIGDWARKELDKIHQEENKHA